MAVFTPLSQLDAERVLRAHGLGSVDSIETVAAGSVNSNFFLTTENGRFFFRIYEEQETAGVAFEWALLDHLRRVGVVVPERLGEVAPGQVRVAEKPTALFAFIPGEMSCQSAVSAARAGAVGAFVGNAHRAVESFGWRRRGRFQRADVRSRLATIPTGELDPAIARVSAVLDEVDSDWPTALPRGIAHGDLFRDNVFWDGDSISGAIDWESAAEDFLAYDLMVTFLAWCVGEEIDWSLGRALVEGYRVVRPLEGREWDALRTFALAAAARFTVTRITDFHLREGVGDRVHKDYRRFLMRLETLWALSAREFAERLGR
ncbi:MAG: homoserine kinase [Myxococcota bacterium]